MCPVSQSSDHRLEREQFHELAAFFPRISMRPAADGEKRSFEIVSVDRGPKNKKDKPGRGSLEHFMPDLKHPEQEGKQMKPVFFVTGQKLDTGTKDEDGAEKLADWITARGNRRFAKAYVNRMWSELAGRGFYEPVDDIGPDRKCSAPRMLDYLAERFAASHYDAKWLLRDHFDGSLSTTEPISLRGGRSTVCLTRNDYAATNCSTRDRSAPASTRAKSIARPARTTTARSWPGPAVSSTIPSAMIPASGATRSRARFHKLYC